MPNGRSPLARRLFALLLLAAVALAAATAAADAPPVENFRPWSAWTARATQFDVNRCRSMQIGDANGDHLDDLICAYDYGGNQTRTFIQFSATNHLTGWASQHPTLLTGFDLNRCRPLLSGDVDGDGRLDLLCPYDYGGNQTRTFVQLASGANAAPWQAWTDLATGFDLNRCQSMQAGDAGDDGYDDLICAYDYGGNQTRTFVQRSSGDAFTAWTNQHPTILTGFDVGRCRPLTSGDVNGDGRLDLICPYDYGLSTRTFIQLSGPATYTPWLAASTGDDQFDLDRCTTLQVGDADGDGHTDLYCPYDYGDVSTTTFVQRAAAYRADLPAVIR